MKKLETKARLRAELAREDQAIFELTGKTGTSVAGEWLSKITPRLSLIAVKNILFQSRHGSMVTRGLSFEDAVSVAGIPFEAARHRSTPSFTTSEWCAQAENHFVELLDQVLKGAPAGQTRVSVYHAPDGQALAIRKRVAVSSAITLVPLEYNGSVLPTGSLVGVGTESNRNQTGQRQRGHVNYGTFEVDELAVNPLRFTPWAFSKPEDRAMFGCDRFLNLLVMYDQVRANSLAATTIGDFQQAAAAVMALCGTRPETVDA